VGHNVKYDKGVFEANGFKVPTYVRDTMLHVYVHDSDEIKNLEYRVKHDLGYEKKKLKEWLTPEAVKALKWVKGGAWPASWDNDTWKYLPLETLAEYASEDAYWTDQLDDLYKIKVEQKKVVKIHDKIELPLTEVLKDMKKWGVSIDMPKLLSFDEPARKQLAETEKKIHKMANCTFNLNSPKQVAEVLYGRMKYKCKSMTKGGSEATGKNALKELKVIQGAEIAGLMLEYSSLSKLYSGFIKAIPGRVSDDGRLRCDFNSEGARTGRFSSSNPNLQNQPNVTKFPMFPIRETFIPAIGYKFIVLDWSQIELRVAAHLSQDPRLMQAFIDGRDIHQEVADSLGITRKDAKAVNFGILYGLGALSLALYAEVSLDYSKNMLANYKETYRDLIAWEEWIQNGAKIRGEVRTMFGRVRPLKGVFSKSAEIYHGAMRQAVNTMIQGTCADLMKIGMLKIHNWILRNGIDARILLTVHDELVIEARADIANDVYWKVKHMMENLTPMKVPIIAEGKICDNWAQGKDDSFKGYQYEGEAPSIIQPWQFNTIYKIA
jgi:DNA polymerase I